MRLYRPAPYRQSRHSIPPRPASFAIVVDNRQRSSTMWPTFPLLSVKRLPNAPKLRLSGKRVRHYNLALCGRKRKSCWGICGIHLMTAAKRKLSSDISVEPRATDLLRTFGRRSEEGLGRLLAMVVLKGLWLRRMTFADPVIARESNHDGTSAS